MYAIQRKPYFLKLAPLWIRDSRILWTKRPVHYASSIGVSISKTPKRNHWLFIELTNVQWKILTFLRKTIDFQASNLHCRASPRLFFCFSAYTTWRHHGLKQHPNTLSDRARSLPDAPEMDSNSFRYAHLPSPWHEMLHTPSFPCRLISRLIDSRRRLSLSNALFASAWTWESP